MRFHEEVGSSGALCTQHRGNRLRPDQPQLAVSFWGTCCIGMPNDGDRSGATIAHRAQNVGKSCLGGVGKSTAAIQLEIKKKGYLASGKSVQKRPKCAPDGGLVKGERCA